MSVSVCVTVLAFKAGNKSTTKQSFVPLLLTHNNNSVKGKKKSEKKESKASSRETSTQKGKKKEKRGVRRFLTEESLVAALPLQRDLDAKSLVERSEKCLVGRPRFRGAQHPVDDSLCDSDVILVGAASGRDVRANGGVAGQRSALADAGGAQDLRTVTDARNGKVLVKEVLCDFKNALVKTDVLAHAAARNVQPCIVVHVHLIKGLVQDKVVAAKLNVCLKLGEVVNGGGDFLTLFLAGADNVHFDANGAQRLKRNHDLVVLDEVTREH